MALLTNLYSEHKFSLPVKSMAQDFSEEVLASALTG